MTQLLSLSRPLATYAQVILLQKINGGSFGGFTQAPGQRGTLPLFNMAWFFGHESIHWAQTVIYVHTILNSADIQFLYGLDAVATGLTQWRHEVALESAERVMREAERAVTAALAELQAGDVSPITRLTALQAIRLLVDGARTVLGTCDAMYDAIGGYALQGPAAAAPRSSASRPWPR